METIDEVAITNHAPLPTQGIVGREPFTLSIDGCRMDTKELKLKKHGYPPKSIFRRGLNILRRLVTNFERFDVVVWRKVIKLLSCS